MKTDGCPKDHGDYSNGFCCFQNEIIFVRKIPAIFMPEINGISGMKLPAT
jgi:hypothetical protein